MSNTEEKQTVHKTTSTIEHPSSNIAEVQKQLLEEQRKQLKSAVSEVQAETQVPVQTTTQGQQFVAGAVQGQYPGQFPGQVYGQVQGQFPTQFPAQAQATTIVTAATTTTAPLITQYGAGLSVLGNVINEPTIDFFNRFVAKDTHCLLGKTGIKLNRICLGTMNFGSVDSRFGERPGQLDESEAHAILDRYLELGGNCIDTADFFPWFGQEVGKTETIIGNWLAKQDRQRVFLITKVRMPQDINNINSVGLSRGHLIDSVNNSLKRLQTDTIDMLVLNGWDNSVSFHDTVKHLDDLVRSDRIRYIGVCDMKGWQLQKLIDTAKEFDMHKVVCYMGEYNLLTRGCELEVLEVCKSERIGFIAYSPLKFGFLSNETVQNPNQPPHGSRIEAASPQPTQQRSRLNIACMAESFECLRKNPININTLNLCYQLSCKYNVTISQIAIQWLLQCGVVTSVCVGVEDVKELEQCMTCLIGEFVLTPEEMDQLDLVSSPELHYPYRTSLSDLAGLRQIKAVQSTEFEQMNVLTQALRVGGARPQRMNLRETWHESAFSPEPQLEFMRYPQMKSCFPQQLPLSYGLQSGVIDPSRVIQ